MFQNICDLREKTERLQAEIKNANKGGFWRAVGAVASIVTGGLLGGPAGAVAGAMTGGKMFDK